MKAHMFVEDRRILSDRSRRVKKTIQPGVGRESEGYYMKWKKGGNGQKKTEYAESMCVFGAFRHLFASFAV
jgi:hypothetical protein